MKKILATILVLLLPNLCFGAISFVTSPGRQAPANGTSNTLSLNCSGGDFLVVVGYEDTTSGNTTSYTYAGVNLVKVLDVDDNNSPGNHLQVWVLHAPASGANNLVFSQTQSTSIRYTPGCYLGVNQADSVDTTGSLQMSGVSGNQTISMTTTQSGDWLLMTDNNDTVAPDSLVNATQRGGNTLSQQFTLFDSNTAYSPAGTYTIGQHFSSSNSGLLIGVAISPPIVPLVVRRPAIISWQGYW